MAHGREQRTESHHEPGVHLGDLIQQDDGGVGEGTDVVEYPRGDVVGRGGETPLTGPVQQAVLPPGEQQEVLPGTGEVGVGVERERGGEEGGGEGFPDPVVPDEVDEKPGTGVGEFAADVTQEGTEGVGLSLDGGEKGVETGVDVAEIGVGGGSTEGGTGNAPAAGFEELCRAGFAGEGTPTVLVQCIGCGVFTAKRRNMVPEGWATSNDSENENKHV